MCHLWGGASGHLANRSAHFEIATWKPHFSHPQCSGKLLSGRKSDFSFVCWASQQRKLGGAQQGPGESCNDIWIPTLLTKPLLSRLSADRSQGRRGWRSQGHSVITPTSHTHPHLGWGLLRSRSICNLFLTDFHTSSHVHSWWTKKTEQNHGLLHHSYHHNQP